MRTKDENSCSLIIAIFKKCKFLEMKILDKLFTNQIEINVAINSTLISLNPILVE